MTPEDIFKSYLEEISQMRLFAYSKPTMIFDECDEIEEDEEELGYASIC